MTHSLPPHEHLPFAPIPESSATVTVSVIMVGKMDMPLSSIIGGKGDHRYIAPVMCYLIEHNTTGKKLVFDLGLKTKIEDNTPMHVKYLFDLLKPICPARSMAEQLSDKGIDLAEIEAVIYSHTHFDHTGNVAHFPSTTQLIVGPGAVAVSTPGYPDSETSFYVASDIPTDGSRSVRELAQEEFVLDIGSFKGVDLWGDGSFYLLDAPGHVNGHIVALARTSSSPSNFILLGGDAAHHRALFTCCLSHGSHPPVGTFANPFGGPPLTMHGDLEQAYKTMAKVARMEKEDSIIIMGAHDNYLEDIIDEDKAWWPEANLNCWKEKGWKALLDKAVIKDMA